MEFPPHALGGLSRGSWSRAPLKTTLKRPLKEGAWARNVAMGNSMAKRGTWDSGLHSGGRLELDASKPCAGRTASLRSLPAKAFTLASRQAWNRGRRVALGARLVGGKDCRVPSGKQNSGFKTTHEFQENSIKTCILSRVKQSTSPGWMHETRTRAWCTGKTQRDRVEREVGGGSEWGTHVNPWLIHVHVWQKPLQYCKVISLQLIKKKNNKTTHE